MTQIWYKWLVLGIPTSLWHLIEPGMIFEIRRSPYPITFWDEGMSAKYVGKDRIISIECLDNGSLKINYQKIRFEGIESATTERGKWVDLSFTFTPEQMLTAFHGKLVIRIGLKTFALKMAS